MHDLWILAESGDFRSQPLLSRVLSISETADQLFILLLLLYSFFGLYTPKRYQRGSKELVNLVKAESDRSWTFCICDHCMADSELSLVLYICYFIYLTLFLVFYPDISYAGILKTNQESDAISNIRYLSVSAFQQLHISTASNQILNGA